MLPAPAMILAAIAGGFALLMLPGCNPETQRRLDNRDKQYQFNNCIEVTKANTPEMVKACQDSADHFKSK